MFNLTGIGSRFDRQYVGAIQTVTGLDAFALCHQPAAKASEQVTILYARIFARCLRLTDPFLPLGRAFQIQSFGAGYINITLWKYR